MPTRTRIWVLVALYHALFRWLPPSTAPLGKSWRRLRKIVVSPCLRYAGDDINIEYGAFFGTGERIALGSRSSIGINARLHGPVSIGEDVMMGPEVAIFALAHAHADPTVRMIHQGFSAPNEVTIEDDVWIGTRAILLPGVRIGHGSIVGAGAVVAKDVPPFSVVAGNPARVVRTRDGSGNAATPPSDLG